MSKRLLFFLTAFSILLLGQISNSYPKDVELASHWKKQPIIIDGKDDDWQDSKVSVDPQAIVLSLVNDNSYLYLYIYCWDKNLFSKILFSGFTVWFNRDDPKNKLGVHYPIGMPYPDFGADKPKIYTQQGYVVISGKDNGYQNKRILRDLNEMLGKMEIITADKRYPVRHQLGFFNTYGIECATGNYSGGLVYELKMPLVKSKSQIYGLGPSRPKNIKISLDFPFGQSAGNRETGINNANSERSHRGGSGGFTGGMHHGGGGPHDGQAGPLEEGMTDDQPFPRHISDYDFPETMNVTLAAKE